MTPKPFSPMTPTISNTRFPHNPRPLFTPRIKSKLSILLYDSSDMEKSDLGSSSPSRESSSDEIDALVKNSRKPTISRLSFPFVKSAKSPSPTKAVKVPSPPLPSTPYPSSQSTPPSPSQQGAGSPPPLSHANKPQFSTCNPHHNTQRQNYPHRGYSRHALAHIKWFWATREEDWETKSGRPIRLHKPHHDESFLETALDDPFASTPDTSARKRKTPLLPVHQPQHELPPMTIHPRRGDLVSLRDPYCIGVDRSFAVLPTWTIGKTLWMYDVHLASLDRTWAGGDPVDVADPYDDAESENESLDASASSVGYSDDSDMTLVDSETENELSPGGSSLDVRELDDKRFIHFHYASSGPSSSCSQAPSRALSDTEPMLPPPFDSSWPRSAYSEPSPGMGASGSGKPSLRPSSWATDWCRRWAYMIEVSHRGRSRDGKPKFFIGQEAGDIIDYFPSPPS